MPRHFQDKDSVYPCFPYFLPLCEIKLINDEKVKYISEIFYGQQLLIFGI